MPCNLEDKERSKMNQLINDCFVGDSTTVSIRELKLPASMYLLLIIILILGSGCVNKSASLVWDLSDVKSNFNPEESYEQCEILNDINKYSQINCDIYLGVT